MAKSPKNYDRWGGVTPVKVVKSTSNPKQKPSNKAIKSNKQ